LFPRLEYIKSPPAVVFSQSNSIATPNTNGAKTIGGKIHDEGRAGNVNQPVAQKLLKLFVELFVEFLMSAFVVGERNTR
jgi:hypothetical protein